MDPLNWCCKNDVIVNFNLAELYNIGLGPLTLKTDILAEVVAQFGRAVASDKFYLSIAI